MLSPQSSDGQRLTEHELTEIYKPEDDTEAIEITLNAIHGCNNATSSCLDASQTPPSSYSIR